MNAIMLLLLVVLSPLAKAQDSSACGSLKNPYGPYDYRKDRPKLPIVEGAHFTPEVEMLVRGHTATRPGADIDYTLRASPNHHRALVAMAKLAERSDGLNPRDMRYSADCWFDRAIRFAPDDHLARLIYAQFLGRTKRTADAELQLKAIAQANPSEALTWLNLALVYTDLQRWPAAREAAERARSLGLERNALNERLTLAGFAMRPPEAVEPLAATVAASAPASPGSQP